MLSRALSLATVTVLIGGFAAIPVQAQNLEAGKSPSQIFAGTCTACHKSPRGLLKTVPAGSLSGFLRQHYTTSSEMASLLSAFLISNGAADTRYGGTQSKPGKDAKSDARPSGPPEQLDRFGRRLRPPAPVPEETSRPDAQSPQQAARPDADGIAPPQAEPGRQGRNARRLARPGEAPDAAKPAADGQAASERGPDGRKSAARAKLGKKGKPGREEPPKSDARIEPTTSEPVKDEKPNSEPSKSEPPKSETAKDDGNKPEGAKPAGESNSDSAKDSAKTDAPKAAGSGEPPTLRADPVPPVTPAPKSAEGETRPVQTATPAPATSSSATSSGESAPASKGTAEPAAPPAVAVSAPPPAPVAPAGPPAPPISQ
jgi:hypothetical protein